MMIGSNVSSSQRALLNNPPITANKTVSSGYLMSQMHANVGLTATGSTAICFIPIWIGKTISVNAISVKVSATAANGGKLVLGIYNESANGGVGTLIQQSAEITMDATTYKLYDGAIPTTSLKAGKYWLAVQRNETVATIYGCNANVSPLLWASLTWAAGTTLFGSKNAFPAYTAAYSSTLPADMSAQDITTAAVGVVAIAPSIALKLA